MTYLTKLFEVEAFFIQAENRMQNKQKHKQSIPKITYLDLVEI